MSSSLSLYLSPKPTILPLSKPRKSPAPTLTSVLLSRLQSKTLTCSASSSSSSPSRDDLLWLREEQRWLREEQRWLREEQRWTRERESLLEEIRSLKLRIQSLERRLGERGVPPLLNVLTEKDLIPDGGGAVAGPILLEEAVVSVSPVAAVDDTADKSKAKTEAKAKEDRKALRMGNEGAEVREMQEALLKLGFYSGEEDMEYSSFSTGTERAVKTWQATLGAREDGIMTAELLERLAQEAGTSQLNTVLKKEGANGAAIASVTEITEVEQKVVKEDGKTEVEVSQHRVFLLGENRWEEPSRLGRQDKVAGGSQTKNTVTKCLSCRGEGRLLCTECDGTGEPNVEPQFLEWVEEGAKCPYCEGLGYTICDVCEGKAVN